MWEKRYCRMEPTISGLLAGMSSVTQLLLRVGVETWLSFVLLMNLIRSRSMCSMFEWMRGRSDVRCLVNSLAAFLVTSESLDSNLNVCNTYVIKARFLSKYSTHIYLNWYYEIYTYVLPSTHWRQTLFYHREKFSQTQFWINSLAPKNNINSRNHSDVHIRQFTSQFTASRPPLPIESCADCCHQ